MEIVVVPRPFPRSLVRVALGPILMALAWSAAAEVPTDLYRIADHQSQAPVSGRGVVESREIDLRGEVLAAGASRLRLALPGGEQLEAHLEQLEHNEAVDELTWR